AAFSELPEFDGAQRARQRGERAGFCVQRTVAVEPQRRGRRSDVRGQWPDDANAGKWSCRRAVPRGLLPGLAALNSIQAPGEPCRKRSRLRAPTFACTMQSSA